MSCHARLWAVYALVLLAAPEVASADEAPGHGAQVLPTGAEDAPVRARRAAARSLAGTELEHVTSRSTEGLEEVLHPDGTVSMDLEGRFQSAVLAGGACTTHDPAGGTATPARLPTAAIDAAGAARARASAIRLPGAAPAGGGR